MTFHIRFANRNDVDVIYEFIIGLAKYEKLTHQVSATKDKLEQTLFDLKEAEVLIGEENGIPVSFMLFFSNYSTFLGHSNIYLEDLFVHEAYRHKGYGKLMLIKLAEICLKRSCKRLDWSCLDWNQSAMTFYRSIGANEMTQWRLFRLEDDALLSLASLNKKP